MKMIILLCLIVIFGWFLLIIILKCRKARGKRLPNHTIVQHRAQHHQSGAVHVIQIGNQFYDIVPISRCHHSNSQFRDYHIRQSESNSHINSTFLLDDGIYPSASATSIESLPSYDDVIRLPNQYPKRNSSNNESAPTLEEIERGSTSTSISTISTHFTSRKDNVMSNQNGNVT